MNDSGSLSPGERFDRLENKLDEISAENRDQFAKLGEHLAGHIADDRAMADKVLEVLTVASKANKRIDAYEAKAGKWTRKTAIGAILLLITFNLDRLILWIKHLI